MVSANFRQCTIHIQYGTTQAVFYYFPQGCIWHKCFFSTLHAASHILMIYETLRLNSV